ncbi:MAG: HD-GYP domain-containing protein [Candidatus Schekmanbacteria bacterium]|nr:HD-GYP domain-containing protein [Candidatus Schekmanbacteria bacterium]
MIKKVRVEELETGMFIVDINAPWCYHPFFTNKIRVKGTKEIDKLKKYQINEVYIDTDLGKDSKQTVPIEKANKTIETKIKLTFSALSEKPATIEKAITKEKAHPNNDELEFAKETYEKTKKTITDELQKIRLEKLVTPEHIEQSITLIVDSITQNPEPMLIMTNLQTNDEYTFKHSINVAVLSILFGTHLNFSKKDLEIIGIGGLLHDCGKMKIPQEILNKPGLLSPDEFLEIKKHPDFGADFLESTGLFDRRSVLVALQHHEKYSGGGYPTGNSGDRISIFGMMVAIADVYDALTSDKPYKKSILPFEALKKLYEWKDDHFNPSLVEHFIKALGIYPIGSLVKLNNRYMGIVISNKKTPLLQPEILLVSDNNNRFLSNKKIINREEQANDQPDNWEISEVLNPNDYGIDIDYFLNNLKNILGTAV